MRASYLVPMVDRADHAGERSFDIYSRLLKDRIVILGTRWTNRWRTSSWPSYAPRDRGPHKDINLYINSPGGSLRRVWRSTTRCNTSSRTSATICVGMAMSMGAILLCGGAPNKRFALPNSKIMIHQGSAGFEGSPADIEIHAKEVLSLRRRVAEILAQHTHLSVEQVEQDIDRDRFMSAEEAKSYGVIDEVLTNRDRLSLQPFSSNGHTPSDNGRSSLPTS